MKRYIFTILIFIGIIQNSYSQQRGFAFLETDLSARASGMAGSFIAVLGDINAIPYNPASLAKLEDSQASASFFKHLVDINAGFFSYGQKLKNYGVVAGYLALMNYGTMDKTDEDGNKIGTFGANDMVFSLSFANNFRERLHLGINLKYINSSIDIYSTNAFAFDLGAIYRTPIQDLNIGVALLNWGTVNEPFVEIKEEMPLSFQIGFSKKLAHMPLLLNGRLIDMNRDTDKTSDLFKRFSIGGEFTVTENLLLRWGYNHQLRENQDIEVNAGLSGVSAGGGLRWGKYAIDYSFTSWGDIGLLNRFSFLTVF